MIPSCALLIDKPEGLTSSDVVTQLKWKLTRLGIAPKGFRIGHAGTLDPFATGILIVLIGEATKLADTYLHSVKSYEGLITLGTETATGDKTGETNKQEPIPVLSEIQWQELARSFASADYLQVPPMYSAKKNKGVALHKLARSGITIDRDAILKKIYHFDIAETKDPAELFFRVRCEGGTYVRVLAEDLAKKAGTLAHLKELRRIQSSDAFIADCLPLSNTLKQLEDGVEIAQLKNHRSLNALSGHIPSFEIDESSSQLLWNGGTTESHRLAHLFEEQYAKESYVLAKYRGNPVALFAHVIGTKSFRLQRIFNFARTENG